jgi:hypothetical protein
VISCTMKLRRLLISTLLVVGLSLVLGIAFQGRLLTLIKPHLERALSDATGYQITFASASFRLMPFIGVRLKDGVATSIAGCSTWRLGRVYVRVELLPLLQKRLEVRRVEVEALDGALGIKDGSAFLVTESGGRCDVPSASAAPSPAAAIPSKRFSVSTSLDDLRLISGRLTLFRAQARHTVAVDELRASLAVSKGLVSLPKLSLRGALDEIPFALEADNASLVPARSAFSLPSSAVSLGGQSVAFSGSYDGVLKAGRGSIRAERITLDQDDGIFFSGLPNIRGEAAFRLDVETSGDIFDVSGDVRLAKASLGGSMSAEEVSLLGLTLRISGVSLQRASSSALVHRFRCRDDRDTYTVEAARGELTVDNAASLSVAGSLDVSNFGFSDEDTTIERVSAKLDSISGQFSSGGDVTVSLALNASSIYLLNPNVVITSVTSVSAPLTIAIPEAGGYSVSGPVTIAGGEISVLDKKLSDTGGTVQISVASKQKTFSSENLSATAFGEPLRAATFFAMTHTDYKLSNTSFSVGGGSLAATLTLGRHKKGPMDATVRASNIALSSLYRAVAQHEDSPLKGSADLLTASVTADSADISGTAKGTGSARLSDVVFTTVDLQELAQGAITSIPALGPKITPSRGPDPLLDGGFSSSLVIGDRALSMPDLRLQFSNLTVEGSLKAGLDSALGGKVSLVYLEDTFRMLGFGIKPLESFLAREGRIAIPLTVSGTLAAPSVSPDMEAIGRFATGRDLIDSIDEAVEGSSSSSP